MDKLLQSIHESVGPNNFEGFMDFLDTMPKVILRDLQMMGSDDEKVEYLRKLMIQLGSLFCETKESR